MNLMTRRTLIAGMGATALSVRPALTQPLPPLMTPATATAHFEHEADDTVLRFSFVEFLWQEKDGKVEGHVELDTDQFVQGGVTYGRRGLFRKGGARGRFYVSFGPQHDPTNRQFWWPPNSTSQQPPVKLGQNRGGLHSKWQGLARNSFTNGYQLPVAKPAYTGSDMRLYFEMSGFGKEIVELGAEHFIDQGRVKIYCDFFYMVRP